MNLDLKIVLPVVIAFCISVVLCPIVIPFLKKLKFGQFVRKAGTPTMGGLIILLSLTITTLIYMKKYPDVLPVLFVTLGFGLIGFIDDYIKVVMKRSMGLHAWQKMLGQIVVTGVFAYYVEKYSDINNELIIPFLGKTVQLNSTLYVILLFFIVLGTVNGANFTDGLDGLASSVTVLIATFFAVVAVGTDSGVAPVACAAVGCLQCVPCKGIHGRYRFSGTRWICCINSVYAQDAYIHSYNSFHILP